MKKRLAKIKKTPEKATTPAATIPEGPARCSKRDGRNWRCSEMAMPGNKLCQKHRSGGGAAMMTPIE